MNRNYFKKINDKMPDLLKFLARDVIRNKLIKNKVFTNTYNEIKNFREFNEQEQKNIQINKLKEKLIYAYENVEYYKKSFDDNKFNPYKFSEFKDINNIPVITKQDIVENFNKFISKEKISYYEAFTGGSSGKPLRILLDKESIYKERAFVYNFWSLIGYDYRKSKMITFRGVEYGSKIFKYNPLYNELLLSPFKLNNNNLTAYIHKINKFKPEFISGYPSAITEFARLIDENNKRLDVNIKGIFLISENCTDEEKKIINKTFNCSIITFYGHSERAAFAEKLEDSYMFNKLYGYTELLPIERDKFRIVCTGFINKKMPIIRYMTDDIVELTDYGINIVGHWDKELLIGKNNEKISIASINFHSDEFNKINRYQFVQNEKGKVDIYLQQDECLNEDDIKNIKKILDKKLKGILEYKLIVVDNIELTNRGKFKKIIQNIK